MKKTSLKKETTGDCRAVAAEIVADVMAQRASLATLLPAAMHRIPEHDRSLLQELCYGSLRYFFSLRGTVAKHLKKPLKQKDNDILALLIIGAYQLTYTRVPDYAAINSSVNAATVLKKEWAKSFVNAILRSIQRELSAPEKQNIEQSDEEKSNHPQWLADAIKDNYGSIAESIFSVNNSKAPMTLRINTHKKNRSDYLDLLKENNILASTSLLSEEAVQLEQAIDVDQLPLFAEGVVSVQDEAAQLCAPLLKVLPEMRVLDACAAPGGKTCHLLELEPTLQLTALDIDERRNQLIHDNLERLQLSAQVVAADATQPKLWHKQYCDEVLFDRILLDAPCSATGVIRHHPDIKLLRMAEDMARLADTQLRLLTVLWPLLKPNGILLYATCSILQAENEAVISTFFNKTSDATIDIIDEKWGIQTAHGRQLLPQLHGHDGFYFSRIRKKQN